VPVLELRPGLLGQFLVAFVIDEVGHAAGVERGLDEGRPGNVRQGAAASEEEAETAQVQSQPIPHRLNPPAAARTRHCAGSMTCSPIIVSGGIWSSVIFPVVPAVTDRKFVLDLVFSLVWAVRAG
jgi:hypothetical protein